MVCELDLLDEPLAAPRAPVARLLTLVAEKNWTSDVNLQGGNSIELLKSQLSCQFNCATELSFPSIEILLN